VDDAPPLYASRAYAETLAHAGRPILVEPWQTYVLGRAFGDGAADAAGPYPIACLSPASDLRAGLDALRQSRMVSVGLVVDGLTGPGIDRMQQAFEVARPFKTHYLVDPAAGDTQPTSHHRYEIRRAARRGVEVRDVALREVLEDWNALYGELVSQHGIAGVRRFPRESFEALAACHGVSTVAAYLGGEMVSCHIWVQSGNIVWSHLAASSARGYANGAAYAVYDHAIRSRPDRLFNLGGAAGYRDAVDDGLARFKAGFSNRTATSWFLGAVLDRDRYEALCVERGVDPCASFFPAYRTPGQAEASDSVATAIRASAR